ncbi:MAG: FeoB-associated Cys-rich membrane protein [Coprococcus sp.]|nr:FeoB-associated Cys-rich membrane protein [Coprococcus sp.]
MGTLVVGIIVLALVGLAGRSIYKNKKAGKCCGDCAHCGGACRRGANGGK